MYLGAILGPLGAFLGPPWGRLGAILGPSWGHLGAILGRLGDKLGQLWGANTKALNNTLFDDSVVGPHAHAYKTNAFLMVLKKQCSTDIENTDLMKMLKSLSHYPCAAKSLVGVNTNAKRHLAVSQKCL
mgnify:CR=1 FL=1